MKPNRFQFSLSDLLLGIALLAVYGSLFHFFFRSIVFPTDVVSAVDYRLVGVVLTFSMIGVAAIPAFFLIMAVWAKPRVSMLRNTIRILNSLCAVVSVVACLRLANECVYHML